MSDSFVRIVGIGLVSKEEKKGQIVHHTSTSRGCALTSLENIDCQSVRNNEYRENLIEYRIIDPQVLFLEQEDKHFGNPFIIIETSIILQELFS